MWTLLVSASDLRDASVSGKNNNRRGIAFQRSVQKRETLDVQHMHFVDEEHTRNDVGFAFLAPVGDFLINLISNFLFDLSGVAGKQGQETLTSRIYHVNFV